MADSTRVHGRVQTLSLQFQILVSNYCCYCLEGALAALSRTCVILCCLLPRIAHVAPFGCVRIVPCVGLLSHGF